jgi:formylmethanofuran dehydrogenase subunit E
MNSPQHVFRPAILRSSRVFRYLIALLLALCPFVQAADSDQHPPDDTAELVQSEPGDNPWNQGRPPADWWAEVKRQHGHVGPWNVLGWRIGGAALRELDSRWGRHELEIICYVPLETPYTCLVDGVAVGTGNSLGRLDLRLAEVFSWTQAFVSVRRKDGRGNILEFRPRAAFIQSILNQPVEKLEALSRDTISRPQEALFELRQRPRAGS